MVVGFILCLTVTVVALVNGEMGQVKVFGALTGFFVLIYAFANYVVWRAGEVPDEVRKA